ncbi:hypothetical protein HYPSUDRAFT_37066 [Hypholoma sublateritium FD-334 SS-4]|uniref:Uncharacterized protein n=1 Tax=Hypholoma sublateritium (strain FD-334 SS-4) TaxID=945553 RepID=A0A0D2P5K8_HYPSF|nr:hypothetical protein HYPSUDRAFT_37066 [Hypholoma sublateritium FD-334 SS-4]
MSKSMLVVERGERAGPRAVVISPNGRGPQRRRLLMSGSVQSCANITVTGHTLCTVIHRYSLPLSPSPSSFLRRRRRRAAPLLDLAPSTLQLTLSFASRLHTLTTTPPPFHRPSGSPSTPPVIDTHFVAGVVAPVHDNQPRIIRESNFRVLPLFSSLGYFGLLPHRQIVTIGCAWVQPRFHPLIASFSSFSF